MEYFISDAHFYHKGSLRWPNGKARPFSSIKEMNDTIINNWNSVVTSDDTVYFIGDFAYKCSINEVKSIFDKLNGKIILIKGNHDGIVLKANQKFHRFESVHDILNIKIDNHELVLCHYPMESWQGKGRNSIHIHGHTHGSINHLNTNIKRLDVSVENCNYTPVSLNKIIEILNK
jgi:calcineurin-like phosphoesterase family protein